MQSYKDVAVVTKEVFDSIQFFNKHYRGAHYKILEKVVLSVCAPLRDYVPLLFSDHIETQDDMRKTIRLINHRIVVCNPLIILENMCAVLYHVHGFTRVLLRYRGVLPLFVNYNFIIDFMESYKYSVAFSSTEIEELKKRVHRSIHADLISVIHSDHSYMLAETITFRVLELLNEHMFLLYGVRMFNFSSLENGGGSR